MYYEVTKRNEKIIGFDIAKIADAIRMAFEAAEADNDFEDGYDDVLCCAGREPAAKSKDVCPADTCTAEDRLVIIRKMENFFRRAVKPRRIFSGGHRIFPSVCRMAVRC